MHETHGFAGEPYPIGEQAKKDMCLGGLILRM